MNEYLESSEYIDWETPEVRAKADELASGCGSDVEVARRCFEFVRDEIKHSGDFGLNPVTLKASEVLRHRTGFCYAKSHLLAALARANGIPAALRYQRLTYEDDRPPFCLHGLNSVHLRDFGWYRIDARGNKEGVDAAFDPPREQLAYAIRNEGERDIEGLFSEPLPEVVEALTSCDDVTRVGLPDWASG